MNWKILINVKHLSERRIINLLILMVNTFKAYSIQELKDSETAGCYFKFYTKLPKIIKNELEKEHLVKDYVYKITKV